VIFNIKNIVSIRSAKQSTLEQCVFVLRKDYLRSNDVGYGKG